LWGVGWTDLGSFLWSFLSAGSGSGLREYCIRTYGTNLMKLIATMQIMRMFAGLVGRVPTGHLWYLLRRMRNEKPHRFNGQIRINTFFPPYPSHAFDRFCRNVIERCRAPYSTYLAATGACPFHCEHCSYAGRDNGQLSTEQMLELVKQVKSLGTCTLGLTGGEPLLRDDLEEIIAAAGPEMVCIAFTTGHKLDTARAKRLAAAGVSCVTVGIESSNPQDHDRIRGVNGSFAEAESAVQACKQAGIYTAISTIGTREKIANGDLEAMYKLGNKWGGSEFRILAPVATGAWTGCGTAMLTPEELKALIDFHIEHNRQRQGPAIASFAYLESDELFGCGAGFHHLFIDANGWVCPCDLTPLSFGKVTEEPLLEIWKRMNQYFPLPRRGCLMGKLVGKLDDQPSILPLPREQSESLCADCLSNGPLPEGYRRLFKSPACVTSPEQRHQP